MESPRHDAEVESAVLCACITAKESLWQALMFGLEEKDFYLQPNRLIWQGLRDIGENGSGEADEVALIHWLRNNSCLEAVGGAIRVAEITNNLPAPGLTGHHIRSLRALRTARDIDDLCNSVLAKAEPGEKVEELEFGAVRILGGVADAGSTTLADVAKATDLSKPKDFLPSGLSSLDSRVCLRPGAMLVLAATPGSGKTSLALQIAIETAGNNKHVLFASAEMAASELLERSVAQRTGLGPYTVRDPSGSHKDTIQYAVSVFKTLDTMHIMEPGAMSPAKIGAMAKMLRVRHPLSLIVADYLQLMGIKGHRGFTREQIVGEIARQLKVLAQEMRVPLIACSQLNRKHKTEKRPPEMHDLRESGAIEAHADAVVMLDRPENEESTMVYVRKDRFGVPGKLRLTFGAGGKFMDYGGVPF